MDENSRRHEKVYKMQVERYISVGFPFFRQRHNLKAWVFIVPVAIFIVGYK